VYGEPFAVVAADAAAADAAAADAVARKPPTT